MIISKKLQVLTEEDLLKEVAEELDLKIEDVRMTYDIWLDFVDHIANETDQCTIHLPGMGKAYVNNHLMRRMYSDKDKRFKALKKPVMDSVTAISDYNTHYVNKPIILKYGLSRQNYIEYLQRENREETIPSYFTLSYLINLQTEAFFKEDHEFRNKQNLKTYFLRDDSKDNDYIERKAPRQKYSEPDDVVSEQVTSV